MKTILGMLTAGSVLLTTGCSELKEWAAEYKAEQKAEEAEQNRIRTLDLDQPIASLGVEAIAEEFEANSVMAENKYMNQPIELRGYIGTIDDSMFDEKNVGITIRGGEYSFSSVSCSKPRSSEAVRELRKNMHVAVRGVITSEEMGIGLSRCKFWIFSQNRWVGVEPKTRISSKQNTDETKRKLEDKEVTQKETRSIISLTEQCATTWEKAESRGGSYGEAMNTIYRNNRDCYCEGDRQKVVEMGEEMAQRYDDFCATN